MSPALMLKLAYGIDAAKIPRADLVVSSGGNTLAANISAARIFSAPNIVYGSVRRFQPNIFYWCSRHMAIMLNALVTG